MSNKGVGIAFKLTIFVLLLGILGISIGILIVDLNIRDDVEAPAVTTSTLTPPSTTTTPNNGNNIPEGQIISTSDKRYAKFQSISTLFEKWMNLNADPCEDFYHYVCGKGQKNKEESPFTISQIKDNQVIEKMWDASATYFKAAPLPVKQAKWIADKCATDNSYTVDDVTAKVKELMNDYLSYTTATVPFFADSAPTGYTLDKTTLAKLIGYAKGKYGAYAFLTSYVGADFKSPDTVPYTYYVDEPLPIFVAAVYDPIFYALYKEQLISYLTDKIIGFADTLGKKTNEAMVKQMVNDILEMDKTISTTMQQDPIIRRQVERNYNPYTLDKLNTDADQIDWIQYVKSAKTLLGDKATASKDTTVIIMEKDITLTKLNNLLKKTDDTTIANYVFYRAFLSIQNSVPYPREEEAKKAHPMDQYLAVHKNDKRTLAGWLRKPEFPGAERNEYSSTCQSMMEDILPWAATRMYVDVDIPNKNDRTVLKENVREIANWIFFGFRSQLEQLNWMDDKSKQGAFDKLNNIELNIAYPDWVEDDAKLSEFYKGLEVAEKDNYMEQYLKLTNYIRLEEVLPLVTDPARDRGDFGSFIGITNAWYQPQMNSITFPEGILQEPFYSPDYPLATIFGGLGSISGHELTHGFDDQGVQWDGIGALNSWMSEKSQDSFNDMAQCVIDEYSSFCPYPGVCVNGANTQGENIADNGGMQAAFKALKAYESLKGADPRLPGFGSSFTSEQLFFLTFAQTWCDAEQNEASFQSQIKRDVHSPAIYRVLGTLQNFPAFRNAFNCPVGAKYTPEKHCDVWTSMPF